jgi:hypothetical protein
LLLLEGHPFAQTRREEHLGLSKKGLSVSGSSVTESGKHEAVNQLLLRLGLRRVFRFMLISLIIG